jgi:hypothetical protein
MFVNIYLFLCRVPIAFGNLTFVCYIAGLHRVEQEKPAHFLLQTLVPIGIFSIPHEGDDGTCQLQTGRQKHHGRVLLVTNLE